MYYDYDRVYGESVEQVMKRQLSNTCEELCTAQQIVNKSHNAAMLSEMCGTPSAGRGGREITQYRMSMHALPRSEQSRASERVYGGQDGGGAERAEVQNADGKDMRDWGSYGVAVLGERLQ